MRPIIDHLAKEMSLYKELITVLQKETEDLVGRDYRGLYETVSAKEQILLRIQSAGNLRNRLIKEAALKAGAPAETLSSLIERMEEGPAKDELKNLQSSIVSFIESIQEINKVNSLIVKGSLENINKTLGFLSNFMPASNYKATGTFDGVAIKGSRLSEGA